MPQYMLDTDTVSFALRGHGRVATRLLEHRPPELCISSITLADASPPRQDDRGGSTA
jgi:predicted nucleic acid-binding protein